MGWGWMGAEPGSRAGRAKSRGQDFPPNTKTTIDLRIQTGRNVHVERSAIIVCRTGGGNRLSRLWRENAVAAVGAGLKQEFYVS